MDSNMEERVMAWVDGALEPQEAAEMERLAASDPEVARLAAGLRRSDALLREAFAAPLTEPVPPALVAALAGALDKDAPAVVVPFRRRVTLAALPLALAASLALVVGVIGSGVLDRQGAGQPLASLGPTAPQDPLHRALTSLASGDVSPEGIQPVLSFRDKAGRACREFELPGKAADTLAFGIGCRTDQGAWDVLVLVESPAATSQGPDYATASGPGADALAATLAALGGAAPVSPEEEARLITGGWR